MKAFASPVRYRSCQKKAATRGLCPNWRSTYAPTPDSYRDAVLPKRRDAGGLNCSVRIIFAVTFFKNDIKQKTPHR